MAKRLECLRLPSITVQNVSNLKRICGVFYLLRLGWIQTSMVPNVPWQIHIATRSSTWMVIALQVKYNLTDGIVCL